MTEDLEFVDDTLVEVDEVDDNEFDIENDADVKAVLLMTFAFFPSFKGCSAALDVER